MATMTDPEAQLAQMRARAERQQLGQFFTPEPLADYLAKLVLAGKPRTVLDPAVGGGRLLRALPRTVQRFGLDIDGVAIDLARKSLPAGVELAQGDFLDAGAWPLSQASFDAIIANPPYIRHHRLNPAQKAQRANLNQRLGIQLSAYADYYVYFFCEAVQRLNPGGRFAFITPALFLDARYGDALKALLMREGTIELITVFDHNRGVFAEARTAAAVTVFTKQSSRRHIVFREAEFNGRVDHLAAQRINPRELAPDVSWRLLLPSRSVVHLAGAATVRLGDVLRLRRGLATGSNSFFCLTEAERRAAGISKRYVRPVLVSGRNLPKQTFTPADWHERLERGDRVWLLWCTEPFERIPSNRLRAYLEAGEAQGINLRTMCQRTKTKPWYTVEDVAPPDYLFTYMSKRGLRFIENTAGVRALTALLCGWVKPGVDPNWARELLTSTAASDALTAAAQDLGEGLRKIEPRRLAEVQLPIAPTGRYSAPVAAR